MPAITGKKRVAARTEQEIREQAIEALGLDDEARFEYILVDGTIIRVPHPLLRPREMKKKLREFVKLPDDEQDEDDAAELLIGEDYEAFLEHDGDVDLLQIELARRQMQGVDHMNGRPIRS